MSSETPAHERVYLARRVYPFSPGKRPAQAVLVRDGRVVATGTARAIRAGAGRGARRIDLRDAVLTPGLVDAHTHFFYWALQQALVIDVTWLPTLAATLERIRGESARRLLGDWVLARGFDQNIWNEPFPTAADLDAVVPDRPAMVRSRDGHSAWLNTKAMQRCGIGPNTPDPPAGRYLRDAHGRPTGVAQETAADALPDPVREFALRQDAAAERKIDAALRAACECSWRCGVVGVHSMDDAPSLAHFQRQRLSGKLGLRVVHAIPLADLEKACALGLRTGLGDDWLRLGAVKIFSDGALGSQTAYMFDRYPGRGEYRGVPVVAGEELTERVVRAARRGWASWIHAIGDRAVSETIDALLAARRVERGFLPHRIEHTQCIRPADVRRMARGRIFASMQPCHILGDIVSADRHWPRARRDAYPFRRLLDAGVVIAAGSDVPIESIDPRRSLHGAVVRADERNEPRGGWFPRQRIKTIEALAAFTYGAAASVAAPAEQGRIVAGSPADFTVWRDDPLAARPEELLHLGIAGCVIAGEERLG